MTSPWQVWRDFSREFARVMAEHERFLRAQLLGSPAGEPSAHRPSEEGVRNAHQ